MSPGSREQTQPVGPAAPSWRRGGIAASASVALLAAAWAWIPSCGERPTPAPAPASAHPGPDETLLVVDGIKVTFGDVAAGIAWYDTLLPEYSERLKIMKVLTDYTLPLFFARRDFAAERQRQFELARTLRLGCGNADELDRKSIELPRRRAQMMPSDCELPVARFVFEPTNLGAASQPLELPQGWVVAAAYDFKPENQPSRHRCDVLQVLFLTHPSNIWRDWLGQLRDRIADRVTYVHPDYKLAMPPWLKLP